MHTVTLSLVSHTNVGKTTLARTLLVADIGEVRDAPHVTEFAEGHELIHSGDHTTEPDRLRLWDTPGFADSARLARRMHASAQPLGWFLSQVWDRWRDRPFWASQQALRHVQQHSDVVLYLVNAAQAPASAGYVAHEMDLLAWVGKPVLVLLNQLGEPADAAAEAADVHAWQRHLAPWPLVQAVLPMDAFARCWVHEMTLWQAVQTALQRTGPADKAAAMGRLAQAWAQRRQATFEACMHELAQSLARLALLQETLPEAPGWGGRWRALSQAASSRLRPASTDAETPVDHSPAGRAQQALATALQIEIQASTARLLALHGLAGTAQAEVMQRVASQFALRAQVPEGKAALVGGAVSGALVGLKADVASGGLTLGGGLLVGALLGALGAAGVARGVNVVRGTDHSWVAFTDDAMAPFVEAALLRYLAVAHFGRGRGDWAASEAPPHWPANVAAALAPVQAALTALWQARSPQALNREQAALAAPALAAALQPLLTQATHRLFSRLYPRVQPVTHNPAA
jgi:hypothetical protein